MTIKKIKFQIIALILILTVSACSKESATNKEEAPKLVKTMLVSANNSDLFRVYPGRVSAGQKVNLSFLLSGQLIKLPIKEGDKIQKAQLIAQIDPKEYEIAAAEVKAKYDLAKVTYERYKKLLPTDAISVSQYDEKKSLYELAKAQYEQALKSVADTKLFAPFSGIIAKRFVENYQYVQAKQPIVSLQDFSDLEIIVNIPEQDVARAQTIERLKNDEGKSVIIGQASFSTIPNVSFPVTVKEASTEADLQTQTYQVIFRMPLPEKLIILPGMTANVSINFSAIENNIRYIPVDAVLFDTDGKPYVWLVNTKELTVHKQLVAVGVIQNNEIQIVSGIENDQTIVVAGGAYLHEGMKVKLLEGRIGR